MSKVSDLSSDLVDEDGEGRNFEILAEYFRRILFSTFRNEDDFDRLILKY